MNDSTFITRVALKNYKSIAACDVRLGSLSFLVGPNGSGKSNFLDALRLVSDALNTSLDHALRDRGGIKEVRRRSAGHPTHFTIVLDFTLPDQRSGRYSFRVGAKADGGYDVQSEACRLASPQLLGSETSYRVESGKVVQCSAAAPPAAASDRLYLVHISGLAEFRPVYDALSRMGFYNLNPDRMRELQSADAGTVLRRDGSNLASTLKQLGTQNRAAKERIEEYLAAVVPGVKTVEATSMGPKETLQFGQQVGGSKNPWHFFAASMSDGTLRALGILVALFQSSNGRTRRVPLVGIEEPEIALHPGAAGVLRNCLRDASRHTQVIVTSHSPDLLDDRDIPDDWIIPVVSENGDTRLGPMDQAARTAIKERLYTAGELLRQNQLVPDRESSAPSPSTQRQLFGEDG